MVAQTINEIKVPLSNFSDSNQLVNQFTQHAEKQTQQSKLKTVLRPWPAVQLKHAKLRLKFKQHLKLSTHSAGFFGRVFGCHHVQLSGLFCV